MVPGAAGNCLLEPFSLCVTLVGGGVFRGFRGLMSCILDVSDPFVPHDRG